MAYATGTVGGATLAKDLMAAMRTTLTAGGLTFVENYSTPVAATWSSICYGNSMFVAVASATATAATSVDGGVNWVQRTLPVSAAWSAVTYGAGLFVAVASGSNMYVTSPDGVTWTQRMLPILASWSSITYGNGVFVAVTGGTSNVAATSVDGVTWTVQSLPFSAAWTAVGFGGGVFVALAASTLFCATSPDGVVWTQRTMPSTSTWTSVVYGNAQFVAASNGGAFATSPNGITWTARTVPNNYGWSSVTFGAGLFVTVPSGGWAVAYSSPDGITWSQRTLPTPAVGWSSIAFGGGQFVTAGSGSSPAGASSPDAITWTQRVLTGTSTSATGDVYKSPAASNQFGSDWFLLVRRAFDNATQVYYQVAETYNLGTHRAGNIGGLGAVSYPNAGSNTNPSSGFTPDAALGGFANNAYIPFTGAAVFPYYISANPNRVIVGVKAPTETGFYAGLYDDLLPAGITQFPLVCVRLPAAANSLLGGNNNSSTGGFTREPLPTASLSTNFEATTYMFNAPSPGFTPGTTSAALYGNPNSVARLPVGTTRNGGTSNADYIRGLLIGCVVNSLPSLAGDTITVAGKTLVRFGGFTQGVLTIAFFVDQSL